MESAGYISAETVSWLSPRETYGELRPMDAKACPGPVRDDLERVLGDRETIDGMYLLEMAALEMENGGAEGIHGILEASMDGCMDADGAAAVREMGYDAFITGYCLAHASRLEGAAWPGSMKDAAMRAAAKFRRLYRSHIGMVPTKRKRAWSNRRALALAFAAAGRDGGGAEGQGTGHAITKEVWKALWKRLDAGSRKSVQAVIAREVAGDGALRKLTRNVGTGKFLIECLFDSRMALKRLPGVGDATVDAIEDVRRGVIGSLLDQGREPAGSPAAALGNVGREILEGEFSLAVAGLDPESRKALEDRGGDLPWDILAPRGKGPWSATLPKGMRTDGIRRMEALVAGLCRGLLETTLPEGDLRLLGRRAIYGRHVDGTSMAALRSTGSLPMFRVLESAMREMAESDPALGALNSTLPFFKEGKPLEGGGAAAPAGMAGARLEWLARKASRDMCGTGGVYVDSPAYPFTRMLLCPEDWRDALGEIPAKPCVTMEDARELTKRNACGIRDEYAFLALSRLLAPTHAAFGRRASVLPAGGNRYRETYLIRRDLLGTFDFERLLELVGERERAWGSPFSATMRELLLDTFLPAWKGDDVGSEDVVEVAAILFIKELGKCPDIENRYRIEAMRGVGIGEVAYRMLREAGAPMAIGDLLDAVNHVPGAPSRTESSLRGAVGRDSRLCMVRALGQVSLTEWQDVAIGGISDIITEYLERSPLPQPFRKIADHVLSLRDAREESIRSALYNGSQYARTGTATFGLKDRQYPAATRELYAWFDMCEDYTEFHRTHGRRPQAGRPGERRLAEWYRKAKRDFDEGDLERCQETWFINLCKSF